MSVPVKIVVVYHSGYGHTVKIAEAVARGASASEGESVELIPADEAPSRWNVLDSADAIIMGAPTYMGSLSAQFKAFMDATSALQYAQKRWERKIAAGVTNGASRGGDKQTSLIQLMTFATQHQMHWVNLGLNYGNNRSYTSEDLLNRDAYTLGVASQANMDQPLGAVYGDARASLKQCFEAPGTGRNRQHAWVGRPALHLRSRY
jgi:NAD(P)H dehydrogenase (quinone)